MEASHYRNFICKTVNILCKTCVFCCKKYPIPVCILFVLFLSYLFFPWVFTLLVYAFPLAGISFIVYRVLLGIDRQKIKRVEDDDRRKKFAKSRRSFKSKYGDRSHLMLRNSKDKNGQDADNIFSKSLNDLLSDKSYLIKETTIERPEVNLKSNVGSGGCQSSNNNYKVKLEEANLNISEEKDGEPRHKAVQWTADGHKNVMDLGLMEAERNKRLESLMVRRRSRKNLGFQEESMTENKNNVKVSAIKIAKMNPFLEEISCTNNNIPGSAPSFMLAAHNPFDLPYDPHEEKLDLSADNFHDEFSVGHQKEPVFCRHESFSMGAFSHPEITHDKHERSFCKDLATEQKNVTGLGTSTADDGGDNKHIKMDHPISGDSVKSNNPKVKGENSVQVASVLPKEDGTESKTKETDVHLDPANVEESDMERNVHCPERKADIHFFYGNNKRVGRVTSSSMLSDLQVEVSDDGSAPIIDELDMEKHNQEGESEAVKEAGARENANPHTVNHLPEPAGANQSSTTQAAPNGLTEVAAVGQAVVTSSSPISILEPEFSSDPNFVNHNNTREADT